MKRLQLKHQPKMIKSKLIAKPFELFSLFTFDKIWFMILYGSVIDKKSCRNIWSQSSSSAFKATNLASAFTTTTSIGVWYHWPAITTSPRRDLVIQILLKPLEKTSSTTLLHRSLMKWKRKHSSLTPAKLIVMFSWRNSPSTSATFSWKTKIINCTTQSTHLRWAQKKVHVQPLKFFL